MSNFIKTLSGSLLIAGTMIGAGMLGIPLITAKAGFVPALIITGIVWLYMFLTGLLFLEVTLWTHRGANVLSMTHRFLGRQGKLMAGMIFAFLYYCLMIAYFAAGAPILASFLQPMFPFSISGAYSFFLFGIIFGVIVGIGLKTVNRVNYILMIGLVISYIALMSGSVKSIDESNLSFSNWPYMALAVPILFSSFGFHNVIPSLCDHFKENSKVLRYSIFFGSIIPLVVYGLWQWLIIGSVPKDLILSSLDKGESIIFAMEKVTHNAWLMTLGKVFGLFAVVTSMLGVSFSVIDFLGDGLKMKREGVHRLILTILTFLPPFILTLIDPTIFMLAIGIAGGFGEAFLNGILPAWLVWMGRYKHKIKADYKLFGGKILLIILLLGGFAAMIIEGYLLGSSH